MSLSDLSEKDNILESEQIIKYLEEINKSLDIKTEESIIDINTEFINNILCPLSETDLETINILPNNLISESNDNIKGIKKYKFKN